MSSSIMGTLENDWHVPNEVFWTVLYRGISVGTEMAQSESESRWVQKLEDNLNYDANADSPIKTCTPDVMVDELFASGEEMAFWANVFLELALRERRHPCDPDDRQAVSRSVQLIWAIRGLAKFLRYEARVRGAKPAW